MRIIPVIDLKGGVATLAGPGGRESYRPLRTALCPEPDILTVARAYLSVLPFRTFYIADLDAIENQGANRRAIERLAAAFPGLSLWVDAGLGPFFNAEPLPGRVNKVLGSETQATPEQLQAWTDRAGSDKLILSLDFNAGGFIGAEALLANPALWPRRIIVMSLARVGGQAGPDLELIGEVAARLRAAPGPERQLYAAGGVRGRADLEALGQLGVHGALLASSLHQQTLTAAELEAAGASP